MFTAHYCEFVIVCELEAICVSVFSWLCLMLFSFVSPAQKKDMRDRSYTSAFYISQLLPHRSSTLTGQILTTDTIIYMHRYFIYLRFVTLCIVPGHYLRTIPSSLAVHPVSVCARFQFSNITKHYLWFQSSFVKFEHYTSQNGKSGAFNTITAERGPPETWNYHLFLF
jgi:hypothetical protein